MKLLMLCLFMVLVAPTFVVAQNMRFEFKNFPLDGVLESYSEYTGKKVEVVQGLSIFVTLKSERTVTPDQAALMIEQKLNSLNIGLFPIASNRLVAAWIDLAKAETRKTSEPLRPLELTPEQDAQLTKEGILPPSKGLVSGGRNSVPRRVTSYRDALRRRRARSQKPNKFNETRTSKAERLKFLQEYNMDLIRNGMQSLPMKLTPEQDAQLIKEGFLPPEIGEKETGKKDLQRPDSD